MSNSIALPFGGPLDSSSDASWIASTDGGVYLGAIVRIAMHRRGSSWNQGNGKSNAIEVYSPLC